jgi:hypothetical protein
MPLYWTIDSRQRMVNVVAEGDVSLRDAMSFFDAVDGAEALPYRKLFDATRGRSVMTSDEMLAVAARVRALQEQEVGGATAVVGTAQQADVFARLAGATAVNRPLKMFDEVKAALRWLEDQPTRHR